MHLHYEVFHLFKGSDSTHSLSNLLRVYSLLPSHGAYRTSPV
nr:MAG TPA: hypothetical protein [Caudoviricetes sp.]